MEQDETLPADGWLIGCLDNHANKQIHRTERDFSVVEKYFVSYHYKTFNEILFENYLKFNNE